MAPCHLIILHPVAFIEGSIVGDLFALVEFAFIIGIVFLPLLKEFLVLKLSFHV